MDELFILELNSDSRMEKYSTVVVLNLEYPWESPREDLKSGDTAPEFWLSQDAAWHLDFKSSLGDPNV